MNSYILTTGTSISAGIRFEGRSDEDRYKKAIASRIEDCRKENPDDLNFRRKISAEINALSRYPLASGDHVFLLHTETGDGEICALMLGKLVGEEFKQVRVTLKRITGLQVRDAKVFRSQGVDSLFRFANQIVEERRLADPKGIIRINVSGGFKSVVPYMTLFGVIQRIPIDYIFEQSNEMITLPPVPVDFDYDMIAKARDALIFIKAQGAVALDDFFNRISGLHHSERDRFECLLEHDGGEVTLSTFGQLLSETLDLQKASTEVRIGPDARKALANASGAVRQQYEAMLWRCQDALWRNIHHHGFVGTDLSVFKPGRTGERMACHIKGSTVFVCELLQHDEYERKLTEKSVSSYKFDDFEPWQPGQSLAKGDASDSAAEAELSARLLRQDRQISQLQEEKSRLEDEYLELQSDYEKKIYVFRETEVTLQRDLESAMSRISALESATQNRCIPFWKRIFR